MGLLQPSSDAGFLKAGFLGFAGTGKTHTAFELALGVREHFHLTGPLAMFDTEKGSDYWTRRIEARTGQPLLVVRSRSLADLLTTTNEAIERGVSVLIVDSISHVWEEVMRSYLRDLQEAQRKAGRRPTTRLEFQDWGTIKGAWGVWPVAYLNSAIHIIVCGRAGYEYDYEENERGKRELVKTGIKMKAEGEFGFEPSLLVEMSKDMDLDSRAIAITARVIKDRFDLLNGKEFKDPTFESFAPHVLALNPAAHTTVDASLKTRHYVNEGGRNPEREEREVIAEKIQHELVKRWPGQSAVEKAAKANALERYWNTGSWKELTERVPLELLKAGLSALAREGTADDEAEANQS
jgi:hypothetical protein